MATVHIDETPPEPVVIRETQVTTDNGSTALTIVALLLVAIIAVGAYLYYNGTSTAPITRTVNHVERNVSDATTGDAAGDTGGTTTRSTTTTTQQ